MKTLIFNGSPRKNGSTAYLIAELSRLLDGEVKVIDAYSKDIQPCIDCRYCWENDGCTQKDGMQRSSCVAEETDPWRKQRTLRYACSTI